MRGRLPAVVLAYHNVGPCDPAHDPHNLFVSPEKFAAQMDHLSRHREVVSLEEAVRAGGRGSRPRVAITFDDAYKSLLEHAVPVLEDKGFPATVFVPTGRLGANADWLDPSPCRFAIMDEQDMRSLEGSAMELESHGHDHIDMGKASEDRVFEDLARSVEILERITNRRPRFLAYPFGSLSGAAQRAARRAEFDAAFTIDSPHGGPFAHERVQVTPMDGRWLFSLKTTGNYMRIRHARPLKLAYRYVKPIVRRIVER